MGYQRFCMRHVYANFQKYYKGDQLRDLFWTASRAYTRSECDTALNEIGRLCPQARQWIENIPGVHWSRAYFPEWLPCNYNQNNFTESFNKMIMDSRGLPICDMIDWIRQKMMVNLQSRRSRSERWDGIVCPKIKKILNDVRDQSRFCDLFFAGGDEYEVIERRERGEDMRHIVHTSNKSCSCRHWQLDGIPCIHAMSAIAHRREKPEQYCHPCYFVSTSRSTYEQIIHPLPDKRLWEQTSVNTVMPPHDRRPPGRPKKKRRRDPNETTTSSHQRQRRKQTVKCGLCGHFGHNRKTCKEPINTSQVESSSRGHTRNVIPNISQESSVGGSKFKLTASRGPRPANTHWYKYIDFHKFSYCTLVSCNKMLTLYC